MPRGVISEQLRSPGFWMTPTLEEIQDVNFPEEGKKTPVGLPGHIFGLEEEMV